MLMMAEFHLAASVLVLHMLAHCQTLLDDAGINIITIWNIRTSCMRSNQNVCFEKDDKTVYDATVMSYAKDGSYSHLKGQLYRFSTLTLFI